MTVPSKLIKPDGPGAGRRSTRISIAIPITISGKDASGRPFKENTRTIILNKHGAKIVTVHQLALGAEVMLENRALGRTAKTTVAWLGDRQSSREPTEVGIQLIEAENIWGIELPPDDWQEGPPPKEVRHETRPTAGPPASAIAAAAPPAVPAGKTAAKPPAPRPPGVSSTPSPAIPTEAPPQPDALAQAAMTRVAGQIEELLSGHLRRFELTLTERAQQVSAQAQATLQEAAAQYEKGLEKVSKQQMGETERQLAAARAEVDALQTRVQELQQLIRSETERSQQNIQTTAVATLQSVTNELNEKMSRGLETITAKVEEHRAQLAGQMNSTLEEFGRKTESLLEDVQARLDKALLAVQEKAPGAVLESLERSSKEFVATLGKDLQIKASSSLGPLLDELREEGRKVVEDSRKQLSSLSQQTQSAMEKEALKLAEEQNIRLRKQLKDVKDQRTHEISDSVKGELEKHREATLSQFQTQLEQAFHASHEKSLTEFKEGIREELLKQLEEAASEFDKRTEENLELFSEQLNEKKEAIVSQATEMFRSKIGQMFLAPQASVTKSPEGKSAK